MRFVTIVLATSVAFAQTTKVFQLTQHEDQPSLQEIGQLLHFVAEIPQSSIDGGIKAVTMNGTNEQVATADWLLHQVDLPATGPFAGVHEYPLAAGGDVLRVFYLTHTSTPMEVQEIATTIRSLADIRRLGIYNERKALAVRGTPQQVALAAWLVDQLNQPAGTPAPGPDKFKYSETEVARVFELAHPETPQQLQKIVTLIRSVADMQREFMYLPRNAIAMRGPVDRVDLAAWLVHELDQPADAPAESREYRLPNDPQNTVRVFYLGNSLTDMQRRTVLTRVRATAHTNRMFLYSARDALVVRGAPEQIVQAQKVVEQTTASFAAHASSTPAP